MVCTQGVSIRPDGRFLRNRSLPAHKYKYRALNIAANAFRAVVGRSSGAGVFSGCLCTLLLFCSATPAFSAKATLAWQANSETDLAGYCAYVNNGNPALPLTRYGCTFLGELSDPKNPTYQLVGLTQGDHCFAVTAFNTRGDESGYSNVVCAPIFESAMPWLKKLLLEE